MERLKIKITMIMTSEITQYIKSSRLETERASMILLIAIGMQMEAAMFKT